MGFWDRLLGRKPKEPEGTSRYVLKRRTKKGGAAKVEEYEQPVDMEDLYRDLSPGIYVMHKYTTGKSGFEQVWGPIEVTGDEEEGESVTPRKPKGSSLEQMVTVLKGMAELQKSAKEEFDVLAPFFGYGKPQGGESKTFLQQMTEAKGQYEDLSKLFGEKSTGDEPIKYDGSVPIWLHPKLIPELVDSTMDKVEKRLTKWGVVEDGKDKNKVNEELPPFPAKPPAKPAEPKEVKSSVEEVSKDEEKEEEPSEDEEKK